MNHFESYLLQWYDQNKRKLPWRENPTSYHVWLSEIMLQQTRVETVKSYYERFLKKLPDIHSLAKASEEVYTKLWEGLGYYSRVQNLHKGAVQIMEDFGGTMPSTYQDLLKIAGIGPYTAAAIASIAFGQKIPAIDGNLLRIFARLTAYKESIKTERAKKEASAFFFPKMMSNRPGDFNQALMDLGSNICTPKTKPNCNACPLRPYCMSQQTGTQLDYPITPPKKERTIEKRFLLRIHDQEHMLIRKRPNKGILAGLYEFPNFSYTSEEEAQNQALSFIKSLDFVPIQVSKLPLHRHIFTHKEWIIEGLDIFIETPPSTPQKKEEYIWANMVDITNFYTIPSAFSPYLKI